MKKESASSPLCTWEKEEGARIKLTRCIRVATAPAKGGGCSCEHLEPRGGEARDILCFLALGIFLALGPRSQHQECVILSPSGDPSCIFMGAGSGARQPELKSLLLNNPVTSRKSMNLSVPQFPLL